MSEDFFFGYVRPPASGITSYQTGSYDEPIYHRYGVAEWEHASGEAVYQYQPIERTPMDMLSLPLGFGRETTDWYPRTQQVNIETMFFWVANMSDEATYDLRDAWLSVFSLLSRTCENLRRHAEALVEGWSSPAADAFLQRVGAALCSLDEWWHVTLENAGGLGMIADAIMLAQINMTRLYEQYVARAKVLALWLADTEQLWNRVSSMDPDAEPTTGITGRDRASQLRGEAIVLAQDEFHDRAVRYTRPVADVYDEVLFGRLRQGRRYEGPLIDFGAALATVTDRIRALQEDAMARLPGGGLAGPPQFAPMAMPTPTFVPPPVFANTAPPVPSSIGFVGEAADLPAGGQFVGTIATPAMPPGLGMPTLSPGAGPTVPPGSVVLPTTPSGWPPALPGVGGLPGPGGLPGVGGTPGGAGTNGLAGAPTGQLPRPGGQAAGGAGSAGYPPPPQIPGAPGRRADEPAKGIQARATPTGSAVRGANPPGPALPGAPGATGRPSPTGRPGATGRPVGPGAQDRALRQAKPALPGASAPTAGSKHAPKTASNGAGKREQTRRPDVLHVPGQQDDSLWRVEPPPTRGTA